MLDKGLEKQQQAVLDELHIFNQHGVMGVATDTLAAALQIREHIEIDQMLLQLMHEGKIVAKKRPDGEFGFHATRT